MFSLPYLPLGPRDPHRLPIAALVLGFWIATILIWAAPLPFLGMPLPFLPWFALCTNSVGLVLSYGLYSGFVIAGPWRTPLRLAAVVVVVLSLSGLHAWIDAELVRAFQERFRPGDVSDKPMAVQTLLGTQDFLPLYGFMAVTMGLLVTNLAARDHQRQLAQAQADARQAQLAALRLQLNPHFLFNTLNAISTMILAGRPEAADRMTNRLSEFLRASLRSDPTEMVDLETEVDGLTTYLDIEAVRFGDRLKVEIDIADEVRTARLPALLLQPLVENAIKHGAAPSVRLVTLRVRAWREGLEVVIVVEDDGDGTGGSEGTGTGLGNVRDRLATAFGREAILRAGALDQGYRVVLRLPIRTVVDFSS